MRVYPPLVIRIVLSVCTLAAFFLLFFLPAGISGKRAFLHSLPGRSQFLPALLRLSAGISLSAAFIAGGIFVGTFFFGRFYCSSICPLGTVQDGINRISPYRKKRTFSSSRRWRNLLRYGFFTASMILFFLGITLVLSVTEPFSLFDRFEKHLLKPIVYLVNLGTSEIMRLFGRYIEIEQVVFSFAGTGLAALTFAAIFLLSFFKGRFFCNTLCPTGTLLSIPASLSRGRIFFNTDKCIRCGLCEKICKAECISSKKGRVDNGSCVLCFSCVDACPVGALEYRWKKKVFQKKNAPREGMTRRDFFFKGAQGVFVFAAASLFPLSFLSRRVLSPEEVASSYPILPPGASGTGPFYARCTACHVCVSKCPEKVIRPQGMRYGLTGFEKPFLDYEKGYCEFECNVCSQVCPTGAIRPVSLKEKKTIQIGKAEIDNSLCVVFKNGTACGACAEICPTTAVFMVPYTADLTAPEVTPEVCIGCGACQKACPVVGKKAIAVTGRRIQQKAVVRKTLPEYAAPRQPGSKGGERSIQRIKQEDSPDGEGFAF